MKFDRATTEFYVQEYRTLNKQLGTSLCCNGSSNMIYLKDLKENKRFTDIGPTMAKFDYFFIKK